MNANDELGKATEFEFLSWKDFVAGWVSGICSISVGYPLETVKVRQQITPNLGSVSQQTLSMLKTEGARSFFRGLSYPLWTTGVLNSLYFGFYGNSLRAIETAKGEQHIRNCREAANVYDGWHFDCFLAGCVGGAVSTLVNTPVELAKTVLQAHSVKRQTLSHSNSPTPSSCLLNLFRSRGVCGCFHGGCILFVRDVPTFGLYAVVYEHTAGVLKTANYSHSLPNVVCEGVAGGWAGVVTWFLALPVDVVKSRYMYDGVSVNRKYTSVTDCVRKTYERHGVAGFYKGLWVTLIRAFPVNLLCFVTYEQTLKVLR